MYCSLPPEGDGDVLAFEEQSMVCPFAKVSLLLELDDLDEGSDRKI